MSDDAAVVAGTGGRARSDQHVPAVSVGVGEHPGIAERVVALWSAGQGFVPSGIGFDNRVAGVLGPADQVGRCCIADGLSETGSRSAAAGVEQEPGAVGVRRSIRSRWRRRRTPVGRCERARRRCDASWSGRWRWRGRWTRGDVGPPGHSAPWRRTRRTGGNALRRRRARSPTSRRREADTTARPFPFTFWADSGSLPTRIERRRCVFRCEARRWFRAALHGDR